MNLSTFTRSSEAVTELKKVFLFNLITFMVKLRRLYCSN